MRVLLNPMSPRVCIPTFVYIFLAVGILLCAAKFLARYIVAPLRLRDRNWMPLEPRFEVVLDLRQAPSGLMSNFQEVAAQFESSGFVALANLTEDRPNGLVTESLNSIWVNRQQGDLAHVIVGGILHADGSYYKSTTIAFRRQYADGSELVTSNTSTPPAFPKNPEIDHIAVSGMSDLVKLYEFHLARVRKRTGSRQWILPKEDQGLQFEREVCTKGMRWLVTSGYRRKDVARGVYRATLLKGTFLFYWRIKWPLKQMSINRRDRAADRELRELGFPGLELFRQIPSPVIAENLFRLPIQGPRV
jgi:hypothetical protein